MIETPGTDSFFNDLNEAKRLNGLNVFERVPLLERLDHFEHIYPMKRV